jgi:NADH:ubiquinone oxidoreductase subunit C
MKQQLPILLTNFRDYLKKNFPQSLSYVLNGELFIKIPFQKLSKFLFFLKQHTQCQYKILSDICAVDYP